MEQKGRSLGISEPGVCHTGVSGRFCGRLLVLFEHLFLLLAELDLRVLVRELFLAGPSFFLFKLVQGEPFKGRLHKSIMPDTATCLSGMPA